MMERECWKAAAAMVLLAVSAAVAPAAVRTTRGPKTAIQADETGKLTQALKLLYARGQYRDAVKCAYVALWKDIRRPEALRYLILSLRQPNQREDAAAFTHILQWVLEDPQYKTYRNAAQLKRWAQTRLKTLDVAGRKRQKEYLARAGERRFTSPREADDLWMTQVRSDLRGLHGLYAWKLVGGRSDARKDWIHNRQGRMHRSGAKYMDDVHGRKGVLFTVPAKKSKRLSRVILKNHGKGKVLRIGARAYGFSFLLNVVAGEKRIFSKTVGKKNWEDLKVPLDPAAAKAGEIVLELVVPEKQRWSEGVFLDYVDLFQN